MMGRDVRRGSLGPYRMPLRAPIGVPDTLAFLRGRWRLERRLDDHRCGVRGTFTGDAEFAATDDPAVLRYAERGELRFGGHNGPATRTLVCIGRPGGAVDVRFADGREFYRLDLGPGSCQAEHLCGRDRYDVTVRVLSESLVEEHWHVLGPQKAYDSVTTLQRIDVSSLA
jgi:Family of unknown function (DUF6314)